MKHIDRSIIKAKKAVQEVLNFPIVVDDHEECKSLINKGHKGIIIINDIGEDDEDFQSPGIQVHGYYEFHQSDRMNRKE